MTQIPDPIDDLLGIHFSHQDNREVNMSQTGLKDVIPESTHIPKGRFKNTPTLAIIRRSPMRTIL
jgi:hypothetical protein